MIGNDLKIRELMYEDSINILSQNRGISIEEARKLFSSISFKEYCELIEQTITPPSGKTIGPQSTTTSNTQASSPQKPAQASNQPEQKDEIVGWPGTGPIEAGMTVGFTDKNITTPYKVDTVDVNTKTVTLLDPESGQSSEYNQTDPRIQKFIVKPGQDNQTQSTTPQTPTATTEDIELNRLKQLAGILENSSAGASGAGGIAIANTVLGNGKPLKRTKTEEKWTKEYTESPGNLTVVGDTKPHQAIGELSANLRASGKRTARRGRGKLKKA